MRELPVSASDGSTSEKRLATAVEVSREVGGSRVLLVNPSGTPVQVHLPDGSTWETTEVFGVR